MKIYHSHACVLLIAIIKQVSDFSPVDADHAQQ